MQTAAGVPAVHWSIADQAAPGQADGFLTVHEGAMTPSRGRSEQSVALAPGESHARHNGMTR